MTQNKTQIKLRPDDRVLIVSDIHLRFPITGELSLIQKSLVARIKQLATHRHAILILNGDIFELWEQSNQTVADIIPAFADLTQAIAEFAGKNHQVFYTVGNHDEDTMSGRSSRTVLKNLWHAKAVVSLELSLKNKKVLIEHGHEHDSYNMSGNNGATHGKTLVKSTLPKLVKTMPVLFSGINDVINRAYLPSFVLSRLVYGMVFPIVFPLTLVFCAYFYIVGRDSSFALAFVIVWAAAWLLVLIADNIIRLIAKHTLGVGSGYIKDLDRYQSKLGFDALVLGHTHQGGVWKRPNYTYANSGCNDTVAIPRLGWLGLHKFDRYVQISDITIDISKKQPFIYHQQLIPLVK